MVEVRAEALLTISLILILILILPFTLLSFRIIQKCLLKYRPFPVVI
jgi:hypothetical protein